MSITDDALRLVRDENIRRHGREPGNLREQYEPEEVEFLGAMDRYKRLNQRPCPTWTEVYGVVLAIGYRRVAANGPPTAIAPPTREQRARARGARIMRRQPA